MLIPLILFLYKVSLLNINTAMYSRARATQKFCMGLYPHNKSLESSKDNLCNSQSILVGSVIAVKYKDSFNIDGFSQPAFGIFSSIYSASLSAVSSI